MMTMQTNPVQPIPATKPKPTLHLVLKSAALGELQNKNADELRAFKAILSDKISEVYTTIRTTNLFISQVDDLRSDIRWYTTIQTEIDAYLTAEFHSK